MSKDLDEQLELSQKVVDLVGWANRKKFLTLLQYLVDTPVIFYAQAQLSARNNKDEKIKRNIYVN